MTSVFQISNADDNAMIFSATDLAAVAQTNDARSVVIMQMDDASKLYRDVHCSKRL